MGKPSAADAMFAMTAHPVQPFLRSAEHAAAELVVVQADGTLQVFPLTLAALANHAAEAALILRQHLHRQQMAGVAS